EDPVHRAPEVPDDDRSGAEEHTPATGAPESRARGVVAGADRLSLGGLTAMHAGARVFGRRAGVLKSGRRGPAHPRLRVLGQSLTTASGATPSPPATITTNCWPSAVASYECTNSRWNAWNSGVSDTTRNSSAVPPTPTAIIVPSGRW